MATITLENQGDIDFVLRDGEEIGSIRQQRPNRFVWHSFQARPPHHEGTAKTKAEALAHLGCKFVVIKG